MWDIDAIEAKALFMCNWLILTQRFTVDIKHILTISAEIKSLKASFCHKGHCRGQVNISANCVVILLCDYDPDSRLNARTYYTVCFLISSYFIQSVESRRAFSLLNSPAYAILTVLIVGNTMAMTRVNHLLAVCRDLWVVKYGFTLASQLI